jgi:hypothetical protein
MFRTSRSPRIHIAAFILSCIVTAFGLAGCGYNDSKEFKSEDELRREQYGTVTGPSGILGGLFGNDDKAGTASGTGLGVNAFLWRASLDTLSIWPVASADPFGGVILTDWYAPPASPSERFKLNVYIMDRALRADGIRVAVFRQVQQGGTWQDAVVQPETATKIEDAILMRARQMRNQTASGQ